MNLLSRLPGLVDTFIPFWLQALLVFIAIVACGMVLQRQVMRVLNWRSVTWPPFLRSTFVRARRLGRYAIVLLALVIAIPLMPLSSRTDAMVHHVVIALFIVLLGWIAFALMNFDAVRQFGISLFASAGIAGIVAGMAARPMLENLIAGVQLALTQPLRLRDAVVIDKEWGWVEEINSTYIVVRLWDWRRQIVPLSYLFQNPFTNWTRSSSSIIGTVMLYLDYTTPVDQVRAKAEEIAKASSLWDGKVINVQVSDAKEFTMEVRVLVSAADSSKAWDLRCEMREKLIAYVRASFPDSLPRMRREDFRMAEEPRNGLRAPQH